MLIYLSLDNIQWESPWISLTSNVMRKKHGLSSCLLDILPCVVLPIIVTQSVCLYTITYRGWSSTFIIFNYTFKRFVQELCLKYTAKFSNHHLPSHSTECKMPTWCIIFGIARRFLEPWRKLLMEDWWGYCPGKWTRRCWIKGLTGSSHLWLWGNLIVIVSFSMNWKRDPIEFKLRASLFRIFIRQSLCHHGSRYKLHLQKND